VAIRRSSAILRAKWGESLAGEARFGLVGLVFYLQAAVLFFMALRFFCPTARPPWLGSAAADDPRRVYAVATSWCCRR